MRLVLTKAPIFMDQWPTIYYHGDSFWISYDAWRIHFALRIVLLTVIYFWTIQMVWVGVRIGEEGSKFKESVPGKYK